MDLKKLQEFIISAKSTTYVGGGKPTAPCRPGSHDLSYSDGDYFYLDSYFGGSDFIGEEVVYHSGEPVWGMNYYGVILEAEKITAAEAGAMIKDSLSRMYAYGSFLGGWEHKSGQLVYYDTSEGDLTHFTGYEWIEKDGEKVYELFYHGGMIQ